MILKIYDAQEEPVEKKAGADVSQDIIMFGRDSVNCWVFKDKKVSRRQGVLILGPEGWLVERGENAGPLRLNGHPLSPGERKRFAKGDTLSFGASQILWMAAEARIASSVGIEVEADSALPAESQALPFDPLAPGIDGLLTTLFRLGQECLVSENESCLFSAFLAELGGALGAERGFVGAYDKRLMRPISYWSRDGSPEAFRVSQTIVQTAVRGLGLISKDVRHDARFQHSASAHADGVRSAVCVPIQWTPRDAEGPAAPPEILIAYLDGFCPDRAQVLHALRLAQVAAHITALGIQNLRLRQRLAEENLVLKSELLTSEGLIGQSPAMTALLDKARKVAKSDATVLIRGESGSGKEILARYIHRLSPRGLGPWIAMNCAAIPEQLLESQLFGHRKGAFTGAHEDFVGSFREASGGTLFLDEIGDMSPPLQAKILRALEERCVVPVGTSAPIPVDIRVIAATHKPLEEAVAAGKFREDLYYRLKVVELHIPPLRERPEDLATLVRHFFHRIAGRPTEPSPEVLALLARRTWPGNVRELRNAIEGAFALAGGGPPSAEDFSPSPRAPAIQAKPTHYRTLAEIEKDHIEAVLRSVDGNVSAAARLLDVSRTTLYQKIRGGAQPGSLAAPATGD